MALIVRNGKGKKLVIESGEGYAAYEYNPKAKDCKGELAPNAMRDLINQ